MRGKIERKCKERDRIKEGERKSSGAENHKLVLTKV